jgi:hypothetical protein
MSRDAEAAYDPGHARRVKVGQIRYGLNWQATAIKMQYERLAANTQVDPEAPVADSLMSHMQAVVDLDFLITAIRRLLRVAEQARSFKLDPKNELKLAIKIFDSHWRPYLVNISNSLEHGDNPGTPFVPFRGGGKIAFLHPGGELDASKLYYAAMQCR